MALVFTTSYIEDARAVFHQYKKLAERAIKQLSDEQLYCVLDPEMNSIAVIMKHMAGNMLSRWTDFLTTDGEKPTRNRDTEFEEPPQARAELMAMWERGWNAFFTVLDPLTEADMTRTVTIRGEAHSVMQAINRQMSHYPYHCGQIVLLARGTQRTVQRVQRPPRRGRNPGTESRLCHCRCNPVRPAHSYRAPLRAPRPQGRATH